jgi:hypothetical protein
VGLVLEGRVTSGQIEGQLWKEGAPSAKAWRQSYHGFAYARAGRVQSGLSMKQEAGGKH